MFQIGKKETVLLDFLESLGALEWRRYQSRIQNEWINDHFEKVDRSKYPPYTSFRYEKEDSRIIKLLEDAIKSYRGEVQWVMISQKKEYGSGINRCILPKYVEDIKEKIGTDTRKVNEYIIDHSPSFGPNAHEDLLELTKHIKSIFKNAGYDV
ncbi:hypothetical protein [Dickeya oryzae]|uniref:hypothetical protein n=1 Tax=Dickeya oryzae TaxID=1240404 RepID=UPI001AECEE4B|nr:hypothetical protein [Dickeya oryzae]MBP2851825.1 hypothetical protein [Dickeya oryzae]